MAEHLRMWGPAAVWAVVLFLFSAWPDPVGIVWFAVNDKVVHLALYSVMGLALGYGRHLSELHPPHAVVVFVGALYGATDEWHQAFVPGRFPSWSDWVADLTGVVFGYVAFSAIAALLARRAAIDVQGTE